jgi:hypothetical protein
MAHRRTIALCAGLCPAIFMGPVNRCLASTTQAYCSLTGTFASAADSVTLRFSFGGVGSLAFVGHSEQGGTNAAGQTVPGGGVDSQVRLFDDNGNFLAGDDDDGPGADPSLIVTPLASGTYRVRSDMADTARPFGNGCWSMDLLSDQFVNINPPILAGASSAAPLPMIKDVSIGSNFGAATFAFSGGSLTLETWHVNDGGEGVVSGGTLTVGTAIVGSHGTNESDLVFFGDGRLVVHDLLLVNAFSSLGFSGVGGIDLTRGRFIYDYDSQSIAGFVAAYIGFARKGGRWDGRGITSSAAAGSLATSLGYAEASDVFGLAGGNFGGTPVDGTAVLVKFTWTGDTDLNGVINFDDYVRTDSGFNNHKSGWFNGDFDYDARVTFDDYVLIDLAFNAQDGTLRRAIAYLSGEDRSKRGMNDDEALRMIELHAAQFGQLYADHFLAAVPEPDGMVVSTALLAAGAFPRRRASVVGKQRFLQEL